MQNSRHRCALIGMGHRSLQDHLPALVPSISPIELVAVQDIDPAREASLQRYMQDFDSVPSPKFYTDIDEMLQCEDIDLAIVATPHHTHLSIAHKLLIAGIPFLKEKPFALNLKQAIELVSLIEKYDGHMRLCVQRHYHPLYVYGCKSLRHIGKVRHFTSFYQLNADAYHDGWRADPDAAGGGCVIDMGYHLIDLLCWYFGVPSRVYSVAAPHKHEAADSKVEETTITMLQYENGLVGQLFLSLCEPDKGEELRVDGQHGYIKLCRDYLKRFDTKDRIVESLNREPAWPSAVTDILFDVVSNIGNPTIVREECRAGLEIMSVIEAMYLSMQNRVPVNPRELTA